jgi:hypothetical protein
MTIVSAARKYLHSLFDTTAINEVAKATGLSQRERKIMPGDLLSTMVFWNSDTVGYKDIAAILDVEVDVQVSAQAVSEKIKNSVDFFKTLAQRAFAATRTAKPLPGTARILIADGMTMALHNGLKAIFPATTRDAAAVKLQVLFDASNGQFEQIELVAGKTSDHAAKESHQILARPGDILLRDLGYFDIDDLEALSNKGIFYVSRIPASVSNFRDNKDQPFDIWKFLNASRRYEADIDLKLASSSGAMRVVAKRLPKKKWKERLLELQEEKKRRLTLVEKTRAKWNLYVTNLSREEYVPQAIYDLYSYRWQLELLFKGLRSISGIDRVRLVSSESALRAYIWARLIFVAVVLTFREFPAGRHQTSFLQALRRIRPHLGQLRKLMRTRAFVAALRLLTHILGKFCQTEKRLRKSSLQKVKDSTGLQAVTRLGFNP